MEEPLQLTRRQKVAAALKSKETIAMLGLLLFVAGVAMLSIAFALMAAGLMLFVYAYLTSGSTKSTPPSTDGQGEN